MTDRQVGERRNSEIVAKRKGLEISGDAPSVGISGLMALCVSLGARGACGGFFSERAIGVR